MGGPLPDFALKRGKLLAIFEVPGEVYKFINI
jgi:hypothetical protein